MDLQALPPTQPLQVEADELTIISQDNLTSKNRSSKNLSKKKDIRIENRKSIRSLQLILICISVP